MRERLSSRKAPSTPTVCRKNHGKEYPGEVIETIGQSGRARLLIISRRAGEAEPIEGDGFRPMIEALAEGGIEARQRAVGDCAEFRSAFREAFGERRPDMAFCSFFRLPNGADGSFNLREEFVRNGIAWVGSRSETLELALSKPRIKSLWRLHGILTPDWAVVKKNPDGSLEGIEALESLRDFPYIVKPAGEGNSRGIDSSSVVSSSIDLYSRAASVAESFGEALIESFVGAPPSSREFTAAMIGNGTRAIVSAAELLKASPSSLVISQSDKDRHRTRAVEIGERRLREQVENFARMIFVSADVRDYARCDIIWHEGRLYAIELNGQPMVPDRWFEACAAAAGLGERQYLNAIMLASMSGNARTGHAFIPIPRLMERILPKGVFERLSC